MALTPSSPSFPYQRGLLETTVINTPSLTAINPGDFLYDNGSGVGYPAASYTAASTISLTQVGFVASCIGFSLDMKIATDGSTTPILVCTNAGQATFPCVATGQAYDIGTFWGLAQDTGGSGQLYNQIVVPVASGSMAVGKQIEYLPVGSTQVLLHVKGALVQGAIS